MGNKDDICKKAGKELADVGQEALDSDDRVQDTLMEALEASGAVKEMLTKAKAESWDPARMWTQFALGLLNDVAGEDLSLDQPYEPGSQQ